MVVNTAPAFGLKLGAMMALCLMACRAPSAAELAVHHDVSQGLRAARAAQQPVLLFYSAPWCTACRALEAVLHEPSVVQALRDVQVLQVDVDESLRGGAQLPQHLQPGALHLQAVPTLLYVHDPDHESPQLKLQGYVGRKRLLTWLQACEAHSGR